MSFSSWLRKKHTRIVFSHDYFYGGANIDSNDHIDPMRFKKVRDLLVAKRIVNRRKILKPDMVSYDDMALVHTEKYLKRIQNPVHVSKILKFETADPWDSTILEFFRIVTGGTLLATDYAIKYRSAVFNLGGGFHHAQIDKAVGFCLINDVAIAIQKYRLNNKIAKPLIIDLDYHQGDGNTQFYHDDPNVFTFSLNASHWTKSDKENNLDINLPENCAGSDYIEILHSNLPKVLKKFNPDIVFYIAGSDPYIYDTIGDLNISRQEMLDRNIYVLEQVQNEQLPLVVVAGGGYGAESWKIYFDFIRATIGKRHHDILQ